MDTDTMRHTTFTHTHRSSLQALLHMRLSTFYPDQLTDTPLDAPLPLSHIRLRRVYHPVRHKVTRSSVPSLYTNPLNSRWTTI